MYGDRFVAAKDGFAVLALEATDEGVRAAGLEGTPEEQDDEDESKQTPAT